MFKIIEGIKAFRSGINKRNNPNVVYQTWVRWVIGWELGQAIANNANVEFVERYLTKFRTMYIVRVDGRYMFDTTDREMYEAIVSELKG